VPDMVVGPDPARDCSLCPRLVDYRADQIRAHPDWFNGPVPSFGDRSGRLLIVGLAPGVTGANRTGRPFTGDYAGTLLYQTLAEHAFSEGVFDARPDDGLELRDCLISNAVRCVPPANKPTPSEIVTCRPFFDATMREMSQLKAIVALGRIAHDQVLSARGLKRSGYVFAHGARHALPGEVALFDSYHCSRYNTNTGRLTSAMFRAVFAAVRAHLDGGG
jgi:uracil-DNA glycosylase